jgi:hypothetical protein
LALTWLVAQGIASQPFDRGLEYNAQALAQLVRTDPQRKTQFNLPGAARDILRADEVDEVYYQVLGPSGELLSGDPDFPPPTIPPSAGDGAGSTQFRDDTMRGVAIRVAYQWVYPNDLNSPAALVQVGETLGKRSVLATEIIKGVMLPQFVILPLAVLPASCVAFICSIAFALNLLITNGLVPLILISMSLKSGALMVIASSGAWVLALVVVAMVAFLMTEFHDWCRACRWP